MARRVVRGLLLLEAAGLLGALLLYRAMDRSQENTHKKNMEKMLSAYCNLVISDTQCRRGFHQFWKFITNPMSGLEFMA